MTSSPQPLFDHPSLELRSAVLRGNTQLTGCDTQLSSVRAPSMRSGHAEAYPTLRLRRTSAARTGCPAHILFPETHWRIPRTSGEPPVLVRNGPLPISCGPVMDGGLESRCFWQGAISGLHCTSLMCILCTISRH